nr:EOG090X0EPM [Eulimnadia texana]
MARLLVRLAFLCLCAFSVYADEEATPAKLLFSKQILNRYLVEGMDIVLKYSLFNIGGSAALDVQVTDNTFSAQDFDIVGGQLKFSLDRLAPGANASHVIVVRPTKYGYYNFTAAEVSYLPTEDASEPQIGLSSEPGQGVIVPFREYDRKFSPHTMDWAAFAVMTLPSLVIPFLLWWSSKSKYDNISAQKKETNKKSKEESKEN